MADSKEKLFSDFAPTTTEQWMDKVTADLKGADFEKKLVWKTNEGFKVKPFYRMEDLEGLKTTDALPGEFPYLRGTKKDNNEWLVRQEIKVECPKEANTKALDILKDKDVDLIITDVMMPIMDGVRLCKLVKQNLRTCHIPVYMLSAKVDIKYQLEGLQVGADDYIAKPFSMAILKAKIMNMLRTRHRIFEHYSNTTEIEPEKLTNNTMDEELLRKAIAVIERNMDNVEFSTEQFAREMNMSRSNLHLKLKAITGKSAIDFIHKIRFNRACQLLQEGKYNVSEISFMVGYNTPSYFAARFKKYIGCLPTEYGKK